MSYYAPKGGLLPQSVTPQGRAKFTESYAFIPTEVFSDIVTSNLPFWEKTRAWIIARPLSGFAETFAQYVVEVSPAGGSTNPEPDVAAQAVLFVVSGTIEVTIDGKTHTLNEGGYAYIPPAINWTVENTSDNVATFHWVRKQYEPVTGIGMPTILVTSDQEAAPSVMPDCNGVWSTTRFVDPADMRHDMHVNIVTFQKGGLIPFEETHVMEHGLYVLQGKARYLLNQDWYDVEPGDFMWLRAFSPQACVATSDEPFRYLLYKDVNRHPKLTIK